MVEFIKHDGKKWKLVATKRLKSKANKIAKGIKDNGCNSRVVKKSLKLIGQGHYYYVLKRCKKNKEKK